MQQYYTGQETYEGVMITPMDNQEAVSKHLSMGNYYLGEHWVDKAIEEYNAAIALDPNCAEAYHLRGDVYRLQHDVDKSIADYTLAIQLNPAQSVDFYGSRGAAYIDKGDLDRALEDFDTALRLDPMNVYARLRRADIREAYNNYEGAISDYTELLMKVPKYNGYWYIYYYRAYAYAMTGNFRQAIVDGQRFLRIEQPPIFLRFIIKYPWNDSKIDKMRKSIKAWRRRSHDSKS